MIGEVQYLQSQINELQNTMAAHKVLMTEAIDKAGENKRALKSAHERLDCVQQELVDIRVGQVTKEDFEQILETTFNRRTVSALKKVVAGVSATVFAAAVAWFFELIGKQP